MKFFLFSTILFASGSARSSGFRKSKECEQCQDKDHWKVAEGAIPRSQCDGTGNALNRWTFDAGFNDRDAESPWTFTECSAICCTDESTFAMRLDTGDNQCICYTPNPNGALESACAADEIGDDCRLVPGDLSMKTLIQAPLSNAPTALFYYRDDPTCCTDSECGCGQAADIPNFIMGPAVCSMPKEAKHKRRGGV